MRADLVAPALRIAPAKRPAGKRGRSGPPGNSNARKHGSSRVATELKELVRRSMDGRTTEAREVAEWIEDYAADLGGLDRLSTGQRTVLQLAAQTMMQLGRVDAFIAAMPSMIHAKRRQLYPVVVQRASLVSTLRALLSELGLERRVKEAVSLAEYLATRETSAQGAPLASSGAGADPTALDAAGGIASGVVATPDRRNDTDV